MPTYLYKCSNRHVFERFLPLASMEDPQYCEQCHQRGERMITSPLLVKGQPECRYDSPITGEIITSHYKRQEDMKRHGCMEYDPEIKTDYLRDIEYRERALDKAIEETVEEEFTKMPSAKRNRLAKELLEDGADIQYTMSTKGES